jgi:hypothetical protein
MTDLWPSDLATSTTRSPLTLLREQASLLGLKTRNIVKAGVRRYQAVPPPPAGGFVATAKPAQRYDEPFQYAFFLEAPALDNYTYRLFSAAYNVNLYPVRLSVDQDIALDLHVSDGDDLIAASEEDFKQLLSKILGSQKTRKVINALLSQSTDLVPVSGSSSE